MICDSTLRYRFFWTWDHTTNWVLNVPGKQSLGTSNPYCKSPDVFIKDYRKAVDWCAKHNVNGIVIWGLLRDQHGGVDGAREVCQYASSKGVKILAGIGLNAYGGVYYTGDSQYSLNRWLKDHPDLIGVTKEGKPMVYDFGYAGPLETMHACPSRQENLDFIRYSLEYLLREVPIHGVQIESGDTGVCQCGKCRQRRSHAEDIISFEDMGLVYPIAIETVKSVAPDALIICETYSSPLRKEERPGFGHSLPFWAEEIVEGFPEGVFVQWVGDSLVNEKDMESVVCSNSPAHHNIMRVHFGTYYSNKAHEPAVEQLCSIAKKAISLDCDSWSIFGQGSPFHTGNELNYLAFEHFGSAENPDCSMNKYLDNIAAPLLGGSELAREFLTLAGLTRDADRIPQALERIRDVIAITHKDVAYRWVWLGSYLRSFVEVDYESMEES